MGKGFLSRLRANPLVQLHLRNSGRVGRVRFVLVPLLGAIVVGAVSAGAQRLLNGLVGRNLPILLLTFLPRTTFEFVILLLMGVSALFALRVTNRWYLNENESLLKLTALEPSQVVDGLAAVCINSLRDFYLFLLGGAVGGTLAVLINILIRVAEGSFYMRNGRSLRLYMTMQFAGLVLSLGLVGIRHLLAILLGVWSRLRFGNEGMAFAFIGGSLVAFRLTASAADIGMQILGEMTIVLLGIPLIDTSLQGIILTSYLMELSSGLLEALAALGLIMFFYRLAAVSIQRRESM